MLVANSFDLWQKDTFFSAAEEVQQSADIMESAYRTWVRARKEGLIAQHLDELERELQMALGTAKWQLEEFERAVRISYRGHGDDVTISRHKQFVSAIEDQITNAEKALRESFNVEGKKPFRWVNLDEGECDDLAIFLSGTSSHGINDEKNNVKDDSNVGSEVSSKTQMSNIGKNLEEVVTSNEDTCDEISYQADRSANNRRMWNSPKKSTLEIVIDKDDRPYNALIEATPKEKVFKSFFWSPRMINWMNQRLRGGQRSQRQQQVSPMLPVNSIRFVLALMLTIFLVGYVVAHLHGSFLDDTSTFNPIHRITSLALFGLLDLSHVELRGLSAKKEVLSLR